MVKARRVVAVVLIAAFTVLQLPLAQASMITTGEALQVQQEDHDRSRLQALLNQQELQQQLAAQGLDPAVAAQRINSMTAEEVAMLNARLDELPAGEGIIGLVALFFIVFIITDALGATDLFTFVKPINR